VGGTAAAHYARHRVSLDDDHVVADLREKYDEVLAALEDTDGWITAFVEKPEAPEVIKRFKADGTLFDRHGIEVQGDKYLASMGIYVFKADVLLDTLEGDGDNDFGGEVIPKLLTKAKLAAYPFAGYWKDIGTIGAFHEAHMELVQEEAPFPFYEMGAPIYTHSRSLPPSRIIGSEITDSMVSEGADITGATIRDSVIGVRGLVRPGSRLDRVVMLGADFYEGEQVLRLEGGIEQGLPGLGIGKDCDIERAIIDKNARVGDRVVIKPPTDYREVREKSYWIRDGICVVPKGAVIPSDTRISG
jgi:glucose-1-phosphate adenylyltransferase